MCTRVRLTALATAAVMVLGVAPAHAWWWDSIAPSTVTPAQPVVADVPPTTPRSAVDVLGPGEDYFAGATEFETTGVTMPEFYQPPPNLPQQPGTLVRQESFQATAFVFGLGLVNGDATRIMYTTTNQLGDIVAVTGLYIRPWAQWTGSGPRPVVSYAFGTVGSGDQCSPSFSLQYPFAFRDGSAHVGYEIMGIQNYLERGVSVVVTDYVGLGTPGDHTYMNRIDQGHATLDVVRAAKQLERSEVTDASPVTMYGYSQGGAAVASAAELQPTYAPDVNLRSVASGAPPADLLRVAEDIDGSQLNFALPWAMNSLSRYYPAMRELISDKTNKQGKFMMEHVRDLCIVDGIFSPLSFQPSSEWTKDGTSVAETLLTDPAAKAAAHMNNLGTKTPSVPVRIMSSTADELIEHEQVRQLADDWCAKGAVVQFKPLVMPDLFTKSIFNHGVPLLLDQNEAIAWSVHTASGDQRAVNSCSTLGSFS